jgi:hypothetical protein
MKTIYLFAAMAAFSFWIQSQRVTPEEVFVPYKPDFEIDGPLFRAYDAALAKHKSIMRLEKGVTVSDFKILLKEEPKFFRIHFVPKRIVGKNDNLGSGGARSEMIYAVDKSNYKVLLSGGGG